MALAWRDSLSIGNPSIDSDHKKIITLFNATEKYTLEWNPVLIGEIFERVKDYVEGHFAREEAWMELVRYPGTDAHAALHRDVKKKILIVYSRFKESQTENEKKKVSTILLKILNEYIAEHVIKEDLNIKSHVKTSRVDVWGATTPNPGDGPSRLSSRNRDIEYALPPELSHLLQRLEYVVPQLPPPERGFTDFDSLCEAAIGYRIDKVLVFFQRHNPSVVRELPPIFISSPEFAAKFRRVVDRFIFPVIRSSRQIQMLSTSFDWKELDSESFWDRLSLLLKDAILANWAAGWDALKLIPTKKEDGTRVLKVTEETKLLREMLAPSTPDAYDLPKIGNAEIETFKSFLDTNIDWWMRLNHVWKICHDIYEQEKDPRVFQQKAREGALRDNLLAAFRNLPEQWGDFVALACHRVFPRISTGFLEKFTTNFGQTEEARAAYVPYTIRYLKQIRQHPEIRERENREDELWQTQVKQLRNFLSGRQTAASPDQTGDPKATVG